MTAGRWGDKDDSVDGFVWYVYLYKRWVFGLCCCLLSSFLVRVMVMVDEGVRAMMQGMKAG